MDSFDKRMTLAPILPFCSIGEEERRLCAVFPLEDGTIWALQATCVLGETPRLTLFAARLAAATSQWSQAQAVVIDLAVPSALSLDVAPVLVRAGASDPAVAWAFETGGALVLTQQGAIVVQGPSNGRITALGPADKGICAAIQRKGTPDVGIYVASGSDWKPIAAGPLSCEDGQAITAICGFAGHIHAARSNEVKGFDLFRAAAGPEGEWATVIPEGAWRYGYDRAVSAMAVVGQQLLVAVDGPASGVVNIGDEHPEILTVDAQGHWQVFSGPARFTPDGLRAPVTTDGPGTPDFKGLTIGGMHAQGKDIVLWLKPRDGEGDLVAVSLWAAETAEWLVLETMPVPRIAITSMALTPQGTLLVAAGADLESASDKDDILALGRGKALLMVQAPH